MVSSSFTSNCIFHKAENYPHKWLPLLFEGFKKMVHAWNVTMIEINTCQVLQMRTVYANKTDTDVCI